MLSSNLIGTPLTEHRAIAAIPFTSTPPIESVHVARARGSLSHWCSRIGIGMYALGLAAGAARYGLYSSSLVILAELPQAIALLLFIAAYAIWFVRPGSPATLSVANGALTIARRGSTRVIPLDKIESAFLVYQPPSPVPAVEILLPGDDSLSCSIVDPNAANALVLALGFGPGKRRTRIPLTTPRRRLLHPLVGIAANYLGSFAMVALSVATMSRLASPFGSGEPRLAIAFGATLAAAIMIGSYSFFKSLLRGPEMTIGDDGISYRSGRKTRFLSRAQISGINQPLTPWMAVTVYNNGAPLVISGVAIDVHRRSAAAWLARERLGLNVQGAATKSTLFGRNGRSLDAWRAQLRQLLDSTYRAQGASIEEAETVLRSAEATDDERAGAAIALRISGAEPARIRIAAEASARPEMREALAAIAEENDDGALEQKLRRAKI